MFFYQTIEFNISILLEYNFTGIHFQVDTMVSEYKV